jgi:pimeloyl-ACP methyl ester carboxylesterase
VSEFVDLAWRDRPLRLEIERVGDMSAPRPTIVFLHEGLGSVAMWKDFPAALCAAAGHAGLVFSRYGYGRSTPKPAAESWPPDFMHAQAFEVLPALLVHLGIEQPWLFGHSDGGSIALLHASRFPVAGVIAVAPHLFVEAVSIASIEKAKAAFENGDLRRGLAKYHDDPDSAFHGWNDAWLSPAFGGWNIEAEVARIDAPILAVQGEDDPYGTMAQIRAIARLRPATTQLLELPDCGHSPHRDQPARLLEAARRFIGEHA